ncbi:hypothetical protein GE253_05190 [Niveispirillum sp. SYP-B3756]|uniref:transposase domain-containing protein n=1 Tax=Niveispirillum sp. SYP-B3756 TaxID=2662178 RepID=UPI00129246E0|nr:transposase domain-containing protein [Niveispirillum sp. SYP-B3756]MQP64737.1 hypothetical protein [Niveispirillum sp. SYP-B3756]
MTDKEWFSASALAALKLPGLPTSERRCRDRAISEGWKARTSSLRGGGKEYHIDSLPAPAQTWLRRQAEPKQEPATVESAVLWAHFERLPQQHKDEAASRLKAVLECEALAASIGASKAEARTAAAYGCTPVTLRRWRAAVKGKARADWMAILAPRYSVQGRTPKDIPAEAWDIFLADYLRLEEPTATACYERLCRIAKTKEWGGPLPSCKTFLRRVERDVPEAVRVLKREGREALDRLFPHQERDRAVFRAMEAVNADGHKLDIFAKADDDVEGKHPFRPLILAIQDLFSGMIVGYRLADAENAETVRLAFGDAFGRFGPADDVYLDNGRGFAAKWITGGTVSRFRFKVKPEEPTGCLVAAGCRIHWATPYRGQVKPIERAFRDLCEYIAKHPAFAGAYTGNRPDAKPENYGSRAIPMALVREIVAVEIAAHNDRQGRRSATCGGRSFAETFAASYAAAMPRRLTDEQRRLFWLASERVTADAMDGAVSIYGARYWHETLTEYRRQKLTIRFDPENLSAGAALYTMDGRFICDASLINRVAFNDTSAAKELAREKKRFKAAVRTQADALTRIDALTVAAMLPGAPAPSDAPAAKVVRPKFGRGQKPTINQEDIDARVNASITRLADQHEAKMRRKLLA